MKITALIILLILTFELRAQKTDRKIEYEYKYETDTSQNSYYRGRIKDLGFFINISPNNYEYYFERGYLLMQLKEYGAAKDDIQKAYALNNRDKDVQYLKNQITAIINVQAWMKSKKDDYVVIRFGEFYVQNYAKEIQNKINTNEPIAYSIVHTYKIGDSLAKGTYFHLDTNLNVIDKMSFHEMAELTLEILPIDDTTTQTAEQRLQKAREDIKANPGEWVNYLIKAGAEDELGNLKQALSDYEKALKLIASEDLFLHVDLAFTHTRIGALKHQLDNTKDAFYHFGKAIELDPKSEYPHLVRGKIYLEMGKDSLACNDFQKVMEIYPYAIKDGILTKEEVDSCCRSK